MKKDKSNLKNNLILITYIFMLAIIIINFSKILAFGNSLFSIVKPFIIGLGMAFVLNILVKMYEERIIEKLDKKNKLKKYKRAISVTLSILTIVLLVWGLIVFVLPQLIDSVKILFDSVPAYMKSLEEWVMPYITSANVLGFVWEYVLNAWREILQVAGQVLTQSIGGLVNTTFSITSGLIQTVVGFVVAIYMLSSKEELIHNAKKILYAVLKKKHADKILEVGKLANHTFSKFIAGQCLEAVILGTLCFIGMLILGMPYPLLISVIIGATNLLPVVGPFVGTVPCAFILLMVDPKKALWFIVFIVILQQIESNLIYPKVVGSSIGLSAIWVLFGITVGGGLYGIMGMLLGVPSMAVAYKISRELINNKLRKKNIHID